MDELMTVKQLAARLQLHTNTVYELIRSGKVKAISLPGGSLRIEAKELKKLLDYKKGNNANPR